jgi:hypothetical protein
MSAAIEAAPGLCERFGHTQGRANALHVLEEDVGALIDVVPTEAPGRILFGKTGRLIFHVRNKIDVERQDCS